DLGVAARADFPAEVHVGEQAGVDQLLAGGFEQLRVEGFARMQAGDRPHGRGLGAFQAVHAHDVDDERPPGEQERDQERRDGRHESDWLWGRPGPLPTAERWPMIGGWARSVDCARAVRPGAPSAGLAADASWQSSWVTTPT